MNIRSRLFGTGGVTFVALVLLGGALFTWTTYRPAPPTPALAVFDVAPPAAPPAPRREVKPGPEKERKEREKPIVEQPVAEPPLLRMPSTNPAASVTVKPVPDPGPPVKETTAPDAKPVPPAPQPSNIVPSWQGQVLAALNKVRRYPREASFRHEQGVPYIRFVMDRTGKVLSSRLERSSGIRSLDSEAMDLPKRAQPLPKPPEDIIGDTIELVVPVAFFLR
ncbi:TonB family protein [Sphingomonas sp. NCPPB 2930]|uniref:energy transducer TonB family protein n=1 Tax=Sphingomonas sp. NCPPB 2930 TaxID=3162788 RepID=UPI0036DD0F3B